MKQTISARDRHMCELLFACKRKPGNIREDVMEKFVDAVDYSGKRNSDGWGVIVPGGQSLKSGECFSSQPAHQRRVADIKANTIIAHTRMATGAVGLRGDANAHPFSHEGYLLAHNGVFSGDLVNENEVDSFSFLKAIVDSGGKTTAEKIYIAAEKFSGYCSCFLLDPDGELYYFKNYQANFTFALTEHMIYGASTKETLNKLLTVTDCGFFKKELKSIKQEPSPNAIYRIKDAGFEVAGFFELKQQSWASGGRHYTSTSGVHVLGVEPGHLSRKERRALKKLEMELVMSESQDNAGTGFEETPEARAVVTAEKTAVDKSAAA